MRMVSTFPLLQHYGSDWQNLVRGGMMGACYTVHCIEPHSRKDKEEIAQTLSTLTAPNYLNAFHPFEGTELLRPNQMAYLELVVNSRCWPWVEAKKLGISFVSSQDYFKNHRG